MDPPSESGEESAEGGLRGVEGGLARGLAGAKGGAAVARGRPLGASGGAAEGVRAAGTRTLRGERAAAEETPGLLPEGVLAAELEAESSSPEQEDQSARLSRVALYQDTMRAK